MIYFDNASTTFPKPEEVYKALDYANRNLAFNVGRGSYDSSKEAHEICIKTRQKLANIVNTDANRIIFSSSATEALNLIINGIEFCDGDNVYISPFEHNAIIRTLHNIKNKININIRIIPFLKNSWKLDYYMLEDMFIKDNPRAVFVSHVSNVTGYILPYEDIFNCSKEYNCINVLDCAQSFGIMNPSSTININYIIFAGHKSLYASFGIAGMIKLKDDSLKVSKAGGTGSDSLNYNMPNDLPYKYETGSINVVAIYGLLNSLEWISKINILEYEMELTNYLILELKKMNNIKIYIPENNHILGIVSFNIDGYSPDEVGDILNNEFNICVRTGYHCSPLVHDFIDSIIYGGTIRISLGYFNTKSDVDNIIKAIRTF